VIYHFSVKSIIYLWRWSGGIGGGCMTLPFYLVIFALRIKDGEAEEYDREETMMDA
jgi:hypothetical protein